MLGTLRRDPAWLALGIGAIALLLVFLGWPLVGMLAKSFIGADGRVGLGGYVRFFADRTYREVFVNTLILGVAVTATSMLVGDASPWSWPAAGSRWPAWSRRYRSSPSSFPTWWWRLPGC
ncbi:hypothetical protein [Paracidovorax citrulli]|uniref:hypothetical protein n=1 Tax=Paracidovorax citrulli TaxID=80869 RepID=UPI001E3ABA36|nr:hypothetical protein [Paracidovorax citrulli]